MNKILNNFYASVKYSLQTKITFCTQKALSYHLDQNSDLYLYVCLGQAGETYTYTGDLNAPQP